MRDKAVHYEVAVKMKEVGIYRLADHGHHYDKEWYVHFELCYDSTKPEELRQPLDWEAERMQSDENRLLQLIKAPVQSNLKNWLREYQEIDIEVNRDKEGNYIAKYGKDKMKSVTEDRKVKVFEDYYDAMDAALLSSLSLLPEFLV